MKVNIEYPKAKCKWCGETYTKTHNRQQYCSEHCRKEAKKEQDQKHRLRYFYKNREKIYATQLGTRTIGAHRNPDDEREQEIIRNEIDRLGLRIF